MNKEIAVVNKGQYQTYIAEMKAEICALNWDDMKETYAHNATDKEFAIFLNTCQASALDPRKKEAFFVKYNNTGGQTITGYMVYLKRADRTGLLDGWEVRLAKKDGKPVSATITIYRKDRDKPFVWEVDASEFDKGQSTWRSMPGFMLKKVCMAQGFRLAFPVEVGELPYTSEEISTFVDDNTAGKALSATNAQKTRVVDVTNSVTVKPVAKPKAKPVVTPKAKAVVKPKPIPKPVVKAKPAPVAVPEAVEPEVIVPEVVTEKVEAVELLADNVKNTIVSTLETFSISKEMIEQVLGVVYDEWNENHRAWLIERYHECNEGQLDVDGFNSLSYE